MAWPTAYAAGARFAFIRAGSIGNTPGYPEYGKPYIDFQFERNAALAPLHMPTGAYFYFRPNWDPILQADFFCDRLESKNFLLPPVIDVEESGGIDPNTVAERVLDFAERVLGRVGIPPIIYTRQSVWDFAVAKREYWLAYDLLAARYITGLTS